MENERTVENGWRTSEERCPHCDASLQGDPLDERHLVHKPDCQDPEKCFCLPYGKVTHFSRMIGNEIQGVYDGVLFWSCPDCGGTWHRWIGNAERMRRAQPYIHGPVGN